MNKKLIAPLFALLSALPVALGQGTFQNLDFESVRGDLIPAPQGGYLYASNALPAWSAYYGTSELPIILYDNSEYWYIGLWDTNYSYEFIIQGKFSVSLGGGTISQTGLVPANALSLLFSAYNRSPDFYSLNVSLAGQSLAFLPVSSNPGYTVYGADISGFAGQTATLTFSGNRYMIDDIRFSDSRIPEPSLPGLLALCVCALAWQLVRRRPPKR
jgi:hypothetical protein